MVIEGPSTALSRFRHLSLVSVTLALGSNSIPPYSIRCFFFEMSGNNRLLITVVNTGWLWIIPHKLLVTSVCAADHEQALSKHVGSLLGLCLVEVIFD